MNPVNLLKNQVILLQLHRNEKLTCKIQLLQVLRLAMQRMWLRMHPNENYKFSKMTKILANNTHTQCKLLFNMHCLNEYVILLIHVSCSLLPQKMVSKSPQFFC